MRLCAFAFAALLAAGPAVLANELDDTFASLKEAEAKKDLALLKKLSAETSALAREEIGIAEPSNATDKDTWVKRVAYAKEVEAYSEYALYSAAVQSPAESAIDLLTALEEQNPTSRYLDEGGYARYFQALEQSGAGAKVVPLAEKVIKTLPGCGDALMVLANNALTKGQNGQALSYAQKLVSSTVKDTKPAAMAQADWDRKRATLLGRGYWISGMMFASSNNFYEADRNLRAALPYIRGNDAMSGPALFALGVANYQLGAQTNNKNRVLEAANFSEQASKIPGGHAQQAYSNTQAMRTAAAKMR